MQTSLCLCLCLCLSLCLSLSLSLYVSLSLASSNVSLLPGTSLSNESLARLLLGLTKLLFLPNGDFLCDCLEWLAYDSSEEFWPKGFSGFDILIFIFIFKTYFSSFWSSTILYPRIHLLRGLSFSFQETNGAGICDVSLY